MPYCSVLECKNDSRKCNLSKGGVSYHRFPKDPSRKEDWLKATGRINWMPVKSSTICSGHFSEKEFLLTEKGRKFLKSTAVPTINIVTFFQQVPNPMDASSSSKRRSTSTSMECKPVTPSKKRVDQCLTTKTSEEEPSPCSSLRLRKFQLQLRWSRNKIRSQRLKIQSLQAKNRKLQKKLAQMEHNFKTIEEMFIKPEEFNYYCGT